LSFIFFYFQPFFYRRFDVVTFFVFGVAAAVIGLAVYSLWGSEKKENKKSDDVKPPVEKRLKVEEDEAQIE
jgi:heme/copper-type cytochrome/quinol oxidase subunit 2